VHHIVLERWSRGSSPVHRLDPRAKTIPMLVLLVALATAHRSLWPLAGILFLLICGVTLAARVPLWPALARAGVVLPFTGVFAALAWIAGEPNRGAALIVKAYVSAFAVLTVVATTPLPSLLRGLELLRLPVFFLTVVQFLYRYLFVVSEEGQHMWKAAEARGGAMRSQTLAGSRFRAASGAVAVLFARSYRRAEQVHGAMIARGFTGRLSPLLPLRFRATDAVFAAMATAIPLVARAVLERMH
jgi:cobalt/nickel transport system permease protein